MKSCDDVESRIRLHRKIFFTGDSKCLQELMGITGSCDRRTLVLWALECSESIESVIRQKTGESPEPENITDICRQWAQGVIKMPEARRAILVAHSMAKRTEDKSLEALYHALGQACSTVHTPAHAPGLIYYELTSIVIDADYIDYEKSISEKIEWYLSRLRYWKRESQSESYVWADFLKP